MALKVEIYVKDIVRPFSPTPQSLRNYKLSSMDQIAGNHYTPTVFFYNSAAASHDYDRLKHSLSKTLSVLYPLAGRLKDGFTIECNDKGAEFIGANVTNYDLVNFLRLPELDGLLLQLFPRDPFPMDFDHSKPMLAVQVNKFRCGATAMAICLWHGVCDGAALAGFFQTWARINRGEEGEEKAMITEATKIFPPKTIFDFSSASSSFVAGRKVNQQQYCTRRFVFSEQAIERMRKEHSDHHRRRLSRVEALFAFIWAAVIRATLKLQANHNNNLKTHIILLLVNLRKRTDPVFPRNCLGNIVQPCAARWDNNAAANAAVTPQSLIGRIRETMAKVNGEYIRKMHTEGGYQKAAAEMAKILSADANAVQKLGISSLCGFPFHECDFGWGKPVWFVPTVTSPQDKAYFVNTSNGGVEVWIGLRHQLMSILEEDNHFLAHVSPTQNHIGSARLPARL